MKRIIASEAIPCPFCGCAKIFVKAFIEGSYYSPRRFAVSCQCSKCHVHGPQIFSEEQLKLPSFEDAPADVQNDLIAKAVAKWNTRF